LYGLSPGQAKSPAEAGQGLSWKESKMKICASDASRCCKLVMQSAVASGRPRKGPRAKNGGPKCSRTLALASAGGTPISPSSKPSIGLPTKNARSYLSRAGSMVGSRVCARRTSRRSWCGLCDAQPTQPSRRTGLQQAGLSMGSLRRALRRTHRNGLRAVVANPENRRGRGPADPRLCESREAAICCIR
jgi:hypothetical protein